jgi:hypothetical protein
MEPNIKVGFASVAVMPTRCVPVLGREYVPTLPFDWQDLFVGF